MDSFTFNKIAGSFLAALLVIFGIGTLVSEIYPTGSIPKDKSEIVVVAVEQEKPKQPEGGGEAVAAVAEKPLAELLTAANVEAGQAVAKKCVACHAFDKDGKNGVGPALYDIVGRAIGGVEGFGYSTALKDKGGEWDYEALNAFLANPREYAAGTKMAFAGLKSAKDRADLILYLRSLSESPKPLP